ncbi:MAG TPA: RsmE family RNA methyltransferase [Candidatus Angelobacter sp.]|jgi:16S rRNA (uracil1498-N3)-methyltransferase|nr:RsmE family RNA methyltransferase [Candidatus Angelobacter sp.]
MTRRRWIADRVEGERAFLLAANAAHLSRVLRAKSGQQFDIAIGDAVRVGTIVSITPDEVEFALGPPLESERLPEVHAVLSIFKFDRLEWAIEKLTELGVASLTFAVARRTEPHLAKAAEKRVERWHKLAHEATQQARRSSVPEIAGPVSLKKAILETKGQCFVLSEKERNASLKSVLSSIHPPITIALGPEGGWTDEELQVFKERGWVSASLGATILRAETAAIAAVAIAMSELS